MPENSSALERYSQPNELVCNNAIVTRAKRYELLTRRERAVIELHLFYGYSFREISELYRDPVKNKGPYRENLFASWDNGLRKLRAFGIDIVKLSTDPEMKARMGLLISRIREDNQKRLRRKPPKE